jgi:hypothetical protein
MARSLPLRESLHSRAMGSSSAERASFATTARLLSCLVTESLVRAIFVPLQWSDCVGIGVVLKAPIAAIPTHDCKQEDVLAIALLRHVPVLKTDSESSDEPRGKEIGLLDPLDMFPLVLVISGDGESSENEVRFVSFCGSLGCTQNQPRCTPSYVRMYYCPRSGVFFHRLAGPSPSKLSSRS